MNLVCISGQGLCSKRIPGSVSFARKVTAVLVEGALANAANDKELSRHDMKQTAAVILMPYQSYEL